MTVAAPAGLRISLSTAGPSKDIHVVRADGRIDTRTAGELDEVLRALIERGQRRLVIDLAGVDYVSSAGWGVLVSQLRAVRDGKGDIILSRMTTPVREIYDLLEFEGLLPTSTTLEAAERRFNGGSPATECTAAQPVSVATPVVTPVATSVDQSVGSDPMPVLDRLPPDITLDSAILQLICEDPFYTIGEIKERLIENRRYQPGYLLVARVLWRHGLLRPKRRFQYYRRNRSNQHGTW